MKDDNALDHALISILFDFVAKKIDAKQAVEEIKQAVEYHGSKSHT